MNNDPKAAIGTEELFTPFIPPAELVYMLLDPRDTLVLPILSCSHNNHMTCYYLTFILVITSSCHLCSARGVPCPKLRTLVSRQTGRIPGKEAYISRVKMGPRSLVDRTGLLVSDSLAASRAGTPIYCVHLVAAHKSGPSGGE